CWKPGHLAETCPNRKSQRLEDCKVKDEDPNALLVDIRHMKLAGKIVDSVEVNNQNPWKHKHSRHHNESTYLVRERKWNIPENPLKVKKWESSMMKAVKVDRVEYNDINVTRKQCGLNVYVPLTNLCRYQDLVMKLAKLEMTFLLGQLCRWIPEVKDIMMEVLISKYSKEEMIEMCIESYALEMS
ncbi:25600_t:CDS:2, partial [Gigaspora rosea]